MKTDGIDNNVATSSLDLFIFLNVTHPTSYTWLFLWRAALSDEEKEGCDL